MRYLVAVSGGIDSVVLLDILVKDAQHELIVAHFDHGIREDSADDERFVRGLAAQYGLPFTSRREELGQGASEALARTRRYNFLRSEAARYNAVIATAHHADDIIETVAINIRRGTGWRGLAVLDTPTVIRPLLHRSKADIRNYALARRLEWVEDSTNAGDQYLRNRLRRSITARLPDETKSQLLELRRDQVKIKKAIGVQVRKFVTIDGAFSRYFLIQADTDSAGEILREMIVSRGGETPTRPQMERALLAIKTAKAGTALQIGAHVTLQFSERTFFVQTP